MKRFSGSAIPRHQVFTLADGTFVIQWAEDRVQELMTGQYRQFDYKRDFGHAITNYELAQLRTSGRVEHYNNHYIWVYPLPEAGRFGQRRAFDDVETDSNPIYIATTLPVTQLQHINSLLADFDATAHNLGNVIVLFNKDGNPFSTLPEAERLQKDIQGQMPDVFSDLSIKRMPVHSLQPSIAELTKAELEETHNTQQYQELTAGKLVVLALQQKDEMQAFSKVLDEMQLKIKQATTSDHAMMLLEDYQADLFIMDIALPDLHGWKMITKIREVDELRNLPITIITDQPNFGATIANVSYLVRPVSIARLRRNIWHSILNNNLPDKEK